MMYYDGRKQHFRSREVGWTNAQKTWRHTLHMCESYDQFFDPSHIPLCVHMYTFRVPLSFDLIDLTPPSPILTLLVCRSFLIFFCRRNSEIYEST